MAPVARLSMWQLLAPTCLLPCPYGGAVGVAPVRWETTDSDSRTDLHANVCYLPLKPANFWLACLFGTGPVTFSLTCAKVVSSACLLDTDRIPLVVPSAVAK